MIDWQQVCLNLRNRYKPLSQVAKEVGSDWQHLNRLARGDVKLPRFDVGIGCWICISIDVQMFMGKGCCGNAGVTGAELAERLR